MRPGKLLAAGAVLVLIVLGASLFMRSQALRSDARAALAHAPPAPARVAAAPAPAKALPIAVKTQAGPALPPDDAPLKDIFAELQARASAGDKTAATRLYRDLNHCNQLRNSVRDYSRVTDAALDESAADMSADQLDEYQVQLDAIENNRRVLAGMQERCVGVSDSMYASLLPSIQRAAELGDAAARACYLQRGPGYDARNSITHPEWFEAYRNDAQALISAGLAGGDWRVVDLLRGAYADGADGPLAGVLGSDPYQTYRYLQLYRSGIDANRAAAIDRDVAAAAAALTPDQVAQADAWAQETFAKDFQGGAPPDAGAIAVDACAFP